MAPQCIGAAFVVVESLNGMFFSEEVAPESIVALFVSEELASEFIVTTFISRGMWTCSCHGHVRHRRSPRRTWRRSASWQYP